MAPRRLSLAKKKTGQPPDYSRLPRCFPSGLTTQGSGVRGRRARLSSGRKHARPRIPCSRLLGRAWGRTWYAAAQITALLRPTGLCRWT
jgi:hypothetical protein